MNIKPLGDRVVIKMVEAEEKTKSCSYKKEGKSQVVIAFGCTGGKHRSVTFAQLLAKHLQNEDVHVTTSHRDISRQAY